MRRVQTMRQHFHLIDAWPSSSRPTSDGFLKTLAYSNHERTPKLIDVCRTSTGGHVPVWKPLSVARRKFRPCRQPARLGLQMRFDLPSGAISWIYRDVTTSRPAGEWNCAGAERRRDRGPDIVLPRHRVPAEPQVMPQHHWPWASMPGRVTSGRRTRKTRPWKGLLQGLLRARRGTHARWYQTLENRGSRRNIGGDPRSCAVHPHPAAEMLRARQTGSECGRKWYVKDARGPSYGRTSNGPTTLRAGKTHSTAEYPCYRLATAPRLTASR